ncbi:hypothetical protein SmJEL517_g00984 [Synchytrium microbalum]|uniref:ABC transporter domain-containing protein n=1 Tax=Synchytrium microbalum TaxID=1806994 RepID=A0A507CGW9_9FUNG|nr:uncharacterized protein SmJEL517_g00984 [Synchytrium microbalum]TPX37234.1 hypothetical protein SmJEL517_g00984 [Synchytrium microbalum]
MSIEKKDSVVNSSSWAVTDDSQVRPAFFSFRSIDCRLKVRGEWKELLQNVSGYCKPGESLAIMGPSGAGKSTLLDVISFRKTTGEWTNDVRLNGAPLTQREFIQNNGYVTSDDLLPPELTTREALEFCAALRLPEVWTAEERRARVDDVLTLMQLNYVEHNKIGSALVRGLSTGERKRVNVAVEMLPVASVLFLDEPTTGLDSSTGRAIIENVNEVVRLRKLACIATIHQPSYTILSQFDNLLLLCPGGQTCYFGTTSDAIAYFEQLGISITGNPAEVYANEQAARADFLVASWKKSSECVALQKRVNDIHSGQGTINNYEAFHLKQATALESMGFYQLASGRLQFYHLFLRQLRIYWRNPLMSTTRFISAIVVGLFCGGAFYGQTAGFYGHVGKDALGFTITLMVPGFGSAAIAYWLERRKQYYHEEAAGYYNKLWYLLAQYVVEVIFSGTMCACVAFIALPMAGFDNKNLAESGFTLYLEAMCVSSLNMICAYVAGSIPYANAAFTIHYFFFLFWTSTYCPDSFILPRSSPVKYFFAWLSYDRLWFYPLMRNEYLGHSVTCAKDELIPLDVNTALYQGLGDTTMAMAIKAAPALNSTIAPLKHIAFATSAQNDSLTQLFTLAANVNSASAASAAAASLSAATKDYITGQYANDLKAYAQYAGLDAYNGTAVTQSVALAIDAQSNLALATRLVAAPVPTIDSCLITDGESGLAAIVGMVLYTTYANGTISGKDVDHWDVTPNGLLYALQVVYGAFYFVLAWAALRYCNFRQK